MIDFDVLHKWTLMGDQMLENAACHWNHDKQAHITSTGDHNKIGFYYEGMPKVKKSLSF